MGMAQPRVERGCLYPSLVRYGVQMHATCYQACLSSVVAQVSVLIFASMVHAGLEFKCLCNGCSLRASNYEQGRPSGGKKDTALADLWPSPGSNGGRLHSVHGTLHDVQTHTACYHAVLIFLDTSISALLFSHLSGFVQLGN